MAKNQVIAGDYLGKGLMEVWGDAQIIMSFRGKDNIHINKSTVESVEVVSEESRKSAASGVARGLVGGALLGPVGMLAGGLSAKNKGTITLAVEFKDGKKSLMEIDDKIYKAILKCMF